MISLRSNITVKVLNYYFLNPKAGHYVNELARILDLDPKNLHRKLVELEKQGIVQSEFRGKQRYFFLNRKSKLAKTYKDLFLSTVGIEFQLRKSLAKLSGVQSAYLYGSYAKKNMDAGSDIDLLVIGNHSMLNLQKAINAIQRQSGREINIVNMNPEELARRKKNKDPFIRHIFSDKHIKLL